MTLTEWLKDPEGRGRAARLSVRCDVSRSAVSQWQANGVPLAHMAAVADETGGAVSVEDMVLHAAASRRAADHTDSREAA